MDWNIVEATLMDTWTNPATSLAYKRKESARAAEWYEQLERRDALQHIRKQEKKAHTLAQNAVQLARYRLKVAGPEETTNARYDLRDAEWVWKQHREARERRIQRYADGCAMHMASRIAALNANQLKRIYDASKQE